MIYPNLKRAATCCQQVNLLLSIILLLQPYLCCARSLKEGYPYEPTQVRTLPLDQGIAIQALDNENDLFWKCEITLGNQEFTVLIDTGSSDLWLPTIECTTEPCLADGRRRYDPAKSSTLTFSNNRSISVLYGGDAAVKGVEAKETLKIGGLTIKEQSFLYAKSVSGSMLRGLEIDGILGLGYMFLSKLKALTPFEQMVRRKMIKEAVFSIAPTYNREPSQGGQLVFGSLGLDYEPHEFKNASLINTSHWEIALEGVTLRRASGGEAPPQEGSQQLNATTKKQVTKPENLVEVCTKHVRCHAIVDSGSALILGTDREIRQLNEQLGAFQEPNRGNVFRFPNCSMIESLPNLVLKISAVDELELTPDMYTLKTLRGDSLNCVSGLSVLPAGQYPYWILGNVLLSNFNTMYDYENKRVGFARLHENPEEAEDFKG